MSGLTSGSSPDPRDRIQSPGRPAWRRVIGILGGLGPHAHLELEALLLEATERKIGRAPRDQDYPPWVLSSYSSTPDRTRALLEGAESPIEALVASAQRLSAADFAVMPCNSAHAFLPELRERVPLPILDMIRETARRAVGLVGPTGTIGLLAASGTLSSGLYSAWIERFAPEARTLSPLDLPGGRELQERWVMEPIFGPLADGERLGGGIKSGAHRDPSKKEALAEPMREAARALGAAGAEVVLTACTEIPLAMGRERVDDIPLLDPMQVAAEEAVDIALGERELPRSSGD